MRAISWPKSVQGRRTIIGESDPTRDDVRPCEYIMGVSQLYMGRFTYTALIELDDEERKILAEGGKIMLTLDGGEVPWSLGVAPL